MKTILASLLVLEFTCVGAAQTLSTDSFDITVDVRCKEGEVTCDNVRYVGVHRKSGKSITLRGRTHHTVCADGVTPCRFLGYVFPNGKVTYFVAEQGQLMVREDRKVLVRESGTWR